jgi:Protein of unknown function (DUF2809)
MLTFNRNYFTLAILLFITEVLIALFIHDSFVRPYLGDVLVVILLYCLVRSFLNLPVFAVCLGVLFFAYTIEFLQYVNIVELLGLERSTFARIILGTSFSVPDLVAYTVGILIVLLVEKTVLKRMEN